MKEIPMEEGGNQEKKAPKSGGGIVWLAVIILIVIVGIVYFTRRGSENPASAPENQVSSAESQVSDDQDAKVFEISGKPFEFSTKEIKVKKGDKVKINFTSTQGMHDWAVDEFNAKTKIVQAGESDSVEFLADKSGTFEYYCSVPTHRQQGMVGKLIVE